MKQELLLNRINSPERLKELPLASLPVLAKGIRERIIEAINHSGHLRKDLIIIDNDNNKMFVSKNAG